ncbi:MAG: peroxiredoxin [Pseudomonadota bacterium]|nr:peroxiredoxin [Pseudomonadota bacterium]
MLSNRVPDFSAPATGGDLFRLQDHAGRAVVLYFYPKDDTPGCTTEGQQFRDLHPEFEKAGAVIAGVSRDSIKSHERFRSKMAFPFPLISDPDERLCSQFGVLKTKNMYGRQVRGVERSTFLIDRHGNLAREWRGVKVPGHVQEVLDAVRGLP